MTVKQLKKKLEQIPPKGAVNKARRRDIVAQINKQNVKG